MPISVLELFKIGIGPSSSHSVGPMNAACQFVHQLQKDNKLTQTAHIQVSLYGSLALTGHGHGTDKAILLGLQGETPEEINPRSVEEKIQHLRQTKTLLLRGLHTIPFDETEHLLFFKRETLPGHANGMRFKALDQAGETLAEEVCYSVGGGFVLSAAELAAKENKKNNSKEDLAAKKSPLKYPYKNATELIAHALTNKLTISAIVMANETFFQSESETRRELLRRWEVMQACVQQGCQTPGTLPGNLNVQRRAPALYQKLTTRKEACLNDPLAVLDWVDMYALAVNEENASGGRVVTAPTNGAAGIIPAVLHYFDRFCSHDESLRQDKIVRFLLTAGAIAILYKKGASLSGAEVGCQGEVGVACSMAAGALTEVMGGTVKQVEQAAEIGMEHNLGLTCDPVGGLVQIPCIERNAMGAVKAINAARMALRGDGTHKISLDRVIATMRRTGADMSNKYKETSRGGLAVNLPEC